MRVPFSSFKRPTLHHVELIVNEVMRRKVQGEIRSSALGRALENYSELNLAGLANTLLFQTENYQTAVRKNVAGMKDPELSAICRELLPLLVAQRNGRCYHDSVAEFISEFAQLSQWVNQNLLQTKVQSFFMVGFIPVVSLLFCLFSHQRFIANMAESSGLVVLLSAVALYGLGSTCLSLVFARRKRMLINSSLAHPAGQAALVRSLSSLSGHPGGCMAALELALASRTDQPWRQLGRLVMFGFIQPVQIAPAGRQFTVGEKEFISQIFSGYLRSSAQMRRQWLIQTHRTLARALKTQSMTGTARLNLTLLALMAIFFLPALFLMLSLGGMNFAPSTLG